MEEDKSPRQLSVAEFLLLGAIRCPCCFREYSLKALPGGSEVENLTDESMTEVELVFVCEGCSKVITIEYRASAYSID